MSLDWFPKCFGNWFSLYRSQQYPGAKCHAVRNYFSALLFCRGSHSGSSDLLSHFPWILSPAGIIPSFARYFLSCRNPLFSYLLPVFRFSFAFGMHQLTPPMVVPDGSDFDPTQSNQRLSVTDLYLIAYSCLSALNNHEYLVIQNIGSIFVTFRLFA